MKGTATMGWAMGILHRKLIGSLVLALLVFAHVFPQLRGLGSSPTALKYGIENLEEAQAYLEHPVLGPRLIECTEATLRVQDRTLHQIFSSPDDLKFRSSMTLFCEVPRAAAVFLQALDRYCDGQKDPATLKLLES